jgi:hypothetical protein
MVKVSAVCSSETLVYSLPDYTVSSKKLAPAVKFLACIREVLGSNLDWDIEYPDRGLPRFLRSRQTNARIVPLSRPRLLPFIPFILVCLSDAI